MTANDPRTVQKIARLNFPHAQSIRIAAYNTYMTEILCKSQSSTTSN